MSEHNIFLESHRELMGIIKHLNHPTILVEHGALDNSGMERLLEGAQVVSTYKNNGVKTLHNGISRELMEKVIEVFLESHRKLNLHL